jgi:hypothetical protein
MVINSPVQVHHKSTILATLASQLKRNRALSAWIHYAELFVCIKGGQRSLPHSVQGPQEGKI